MSGRALGKLCKLTSFLPSVYFFRLFMPVGIAILSKSNSFIDSLKFIILSSILSFGTVARISSNTLFSSSPIAFGKLLRTKSKPFTCSLFTLTPLSLIIFIPYLFLTMNKPDLAIRLLLYLKPMFV